MCSFNVGRLQRVALREVWNHEAQDFIQWLQNNIEVLNESLELNLLGANRERSAGDFSVDLVAEDEDGGTVIIENQLEKSFWAWKFRALPYLTHPLFAMLDSPNHTENSANPASLQSPLACSQPTVCSKTVVVPCSKRIISKQNGSDRLICNPLKRGVE